MTVPVDPPRGEHTSESGIQKPRRAEGWWLLAVGTAILVGLLGHLLNQQRTSQKTPDVAPVQGTKRASAAAPAPEASRRNETSTVKPNTAPMRVVYTVAHKHRLRDCHGTLTFTRTGLRFDSDEPQDSFDVGRDDVTIEGDVLRIRDKTWRFEFSDAVRVDRLFSDWKAGKLTAAPAR